jgi:hypothetical protein
VSIGDAERGQASVELVAGTVLAVFVGVLALQLLAAGYAAVMAGHAAEAGALALANGRAAGPAARAAVPVWPDDATRVEVDGDTVEVTLAPPSPLRFLRDRLSATGRAVVRLPAGAQAATQPRRRWDR